MKLCDLQKKVELAKAREKEQLLRSVQNKKGERHQLTTTIQSLGENIRYPNTVCLVHESPDIWIGGWIQIKKI